MAEHLVPIVYKGVDALHLHATSIVCVFEHHVLSNQACNNDSVASAVKWIPKALQITPVDHLLLE